MHYSLRNKQKDVYTIYTQALFSAARGTVAFKVRASVFFLSVYSLGLLLPCCSFKLCGFPFIFAHEQHFIRCTMGKVELPASETTV